MESSCSERIIHNVIIKAVDKKAINPQAWFSGKLLSTSIWNLQSPNLHTFKMQRQFLNICGPRSGRTHSQINY